MLVDIYLKKEFFGELIRERAYFPVPPKRDDLIKLLDESPKFYRVIEDPYWVEVRKNRFRCTINVDTSL